MSQRVGLWHYQWSFWWRIVAIEPLEQETSHGRNA